MGRGTGRRSQYFAKLMLKALDGTWSWRSGGPGRRRLEQQQPELVRLRPRAHLNSTHLWCPMDKKLRAAQYVGVCAVLEVWMACVPFVHVQEKKITMDGLAISPAALAEMISLIEDATISGKIAKDVLPDLLEGKGNKGEKQGNIGRVCMLGSNGRLGD